MRSGVHRLVPVVVAGFVGLTAKAIPLAAQGGEPRPKVAVVSFENRTEWWPEELGAAVADQLATRLVEAGRYQVIERAALEQLMEEHAIQMSGAVDPAQVTELGKFAGVDFILVGSIAGFDINRRSVGFGGMSVAETKFESVLTVRAISTKTAEVVVAVEGEGENKKRGGSWGEINFDEHSGFSIGAVREATRPALDQIVAGFDSQYERFAVDGSVSAPPAVVGRASDGSLYLDQGENRGVEVGQRFEVHRVIDEIRDADGNLLDSVTDTVGTIEVVRVLSKSSIARLVDGEYKEGDRLAAVEGDDGG